MAFYIARGEKNDNIRRLTTRSIGIKPRFRPSSVGIGIPHCNANIRIRNNVAVFEKVPGSVGAASVDHGMEQGSDLKRNLTYRCDYDQPDMNLLETSRTYIAPSSGRNEFRDRFADENSDCSEEGSASDEMEKGTPSPDRLSDIVPPLDLSSIELNPSRSDLTFSCRGRQRNRDHDSQNKPDLTRKKSEKHVSFVDETPAWIEEVSINYEIRRLSPSPERLSDIGPPLDMYADDKNTGNDRDADLYFKYANSTKPMWKLDVAYENWLYAKRKLLYEQERRRKEAEEEKIAELQARKRLSEAKYKDWMEKKAREQLRSREKLQAAKAAEEDQMQKLKSREMKAQLKFEEWKRIKALEAETRRILKQQKEEELRAVENSRQKQASKAWKKWIATAEHKPKPVPLNQGVFSLRGTVSDIYVNPIEWNASVDEPMQED